MPKKPRSEEIKSKTINEIRKTGIDLIGNVPWGTHFCNFYKTKEDLIEILVPYFRAGLENNEFCMWVTSEPLNVEEAKNELSKKVKNLSDYIKKGRIEIIDYTKWYTKSGRFDAGIVLNGWIDKEKKALQKGFDGLRLTGNTFWLEEEGWKEFTDYEAVVNNVIGKYKILALCAYSLDKCSASEVIDVVNNHKFALIKRKNKWELIESSESKKAEYDLHISRERYNIATRSAKVGVWDWDVKNNTFYLDPNVKANLGYKDHEIPNDLNKWLEYVHPEDREPAMKAAQEHMDGKTPEYVFEHRMFHKNGSIRWIMVRGKAIRDSDGKVVRFVGTDTDITERKKVEEDLKLSEQRYALAQLVANIGSWDWDIVTGKIVWSETVEPMFGFSEGKFRGTYRAFLDCVHPEDRQYVENSLNDCINQYKDYRIEHRIVWPDRTVHWVSATGSVIRDKKGKAVRMIGIVRDITEKKKSEISLKSALKEKEILLKEVHHRVKNNLQVISSLLNLQSRYLKDEQTKNIFEKSKDRIGSIALIHELLYKSENLKNIDFSKYVEGLIENLLSSYMVKPSDVSFNIDVGHIVVDVQTAISCGLIINELVSNSLKHAFPKGKKGEISIKLRTGKDDILKLMLMDNGVGFKKDFDFDNAESLGLQLVKTLTEQLGSTIEIDHSKGTKFTIKFKNTTHQTTLPKWQKY